MLPAAGPTAPIGRAMLAVMAAYFDDINARGGIYSRRLELVTSFYDAAGQAALEKASRLMDDEDVFALVGAVIAGTDRQIAGLAEHKKVPLIGPFSFFSADPDALNEFTFKRIHLLPAVRAHRAGPGNGGLCRRRPETEQPPHRGARRR
jgi:ABC-type branched-subunit amino acid transport system substrate-binding protein